VPRSPVVNLPHGPCWVLEDRSGGLLTLAFGATISPSPGTSGRFALDDRDQAMTTEGSNEGLDLRRRKLRFRSWHRGMREMDLIMGRFADAFLDRLNEDELARFEHLIEVPDRDLLAWVTGEEAVPKDYDSALLRKLREFHLGGRTGDGP
jgi:antitoxin CptB